MTTPTKIRPLRVFVSHASEDKPAVRELCTYLRSAGLDIWLDEDKLLPGQDWRAEISAAISNCDAIIVFLSRNATTKDGYIQREIKLALDVADAKPDGTIFLIPARLDDSSVPVRLKTWQWVDLFPTGDKGRGKLLDALIQRAQGLNSVMLPSVPNNEAVPQRTLKYFYYVSRPKLEMLGSQLGFQSFGETSKGVVRHVEDITMALESRGLISAPPCTGEIETGRFYRSTGTWRHGLFYFKAGYHSRHDLVTGIMYVLWTTVGDSILLLTGSPEHILGEKVVRQGIFIPGTSGAVDELFRIATALSVDEPALVTGKKTGPCRYAGPVGYDIQAEANRDEIDAFRDRRLPLPYTTWSSESNALALAMLCFRQLRDLSSMRLDVLFRLFSKESATGLNMQSDLDATRDEWLNYDFIRDDPDGLAEEKVLWKNIDDQVAHYELKKYSHVFVGSPLYTALL